MTPIYWDARSGVNWSHGVDTGHIGQTLLSVSCSKSVRMPEPTAEIAKLETGPVAIESRPSSSLSSPEASTRRQKTKQEIT